MNLHFDFDTERKPRIRAGREDIMKLIKDELINVRDEIRRLKCWEIAGELFLDAQEVILVLKNHIDNQTVGHSNLDGKIRFKDNASWPHPTDDENRNAIWNVIHNHKNVDYPDLLLVASMAQAYCELITHPAFTLKKCQEIISRIRKAIGR